MTFAEIVERLKRLDTSAVCDADKALRVLDPEIQLRTGVTPMIGRAYTVTCHEDFLTVLVGLRDALPGDVLVIDTKGSTRAVAGELFATEAKRKGLAGIVVDGPCRDTDRLVDIGLPVYSRSVTPMAGTTQRVFGTESEICLGEVEVYTGDVVFGDSDGVVVAKPEELAVAIPKAECIKEKEAAILERMKEGRSLLDMINLDEHYENVRTGRPSSLKFTI